MVSQRLVCVRHHGGGAGRAPFGRPGPGRAGEGAVVVPGVGAAGPAAGGPPPALLPRGAGGSDPARAAGGDSGAAGGGPPCPTGVTGGDAPRDSPGLPRRRRGGGSASPGPHLAGLGGPGMGRRRGGLSPVAGRAVLDISAAPAPRSPAVPGGGCPGPDGCPGPGRGQGHPGGGVRCGPLPVDSGAPASPGGPSPGGLQPGGAGRHSLPRTGPLAGEPSVGEASSAAGPGDPLVQPPGPLGCPPGGQGPGAGL